MVALTAPTSAALDVTTPVMGHAKACPTELPRPEMPEIGSPVALVNVTAEGVPRFGVVNVGEVDNTTEPEPVLVVTPVPPFAAGSVPVTPVVSGRPVALVSVTDAGVPNAGVTSVGEFDNTTEPDPVLVVEPVPPFPTGRVPVIPVERGSPVAFVSTAEDGVPSAGVTNDGEVASTTEPLPVDAVAPVPPFATVNGFCNVRLLKVGVGYCCAHTNTGISMHIARSDRSIFAFMKFPFLVQ